MKSAAAETSRSEGVLSLEELREVMAGCIQEITKNCPGAVSDALKILLHTYRHTECSEAKKEIMEHGAIINALRKFYPCAPIRCHSSNFNSALREMSQPSVVMLARTQHGKPFRVRLNCATP